MKKGISLFLLLPLLAVATVPATSQTAARKGAKTLIAYFSRVGTSRPFAGVEAVSSASLPQGNTIILANMIHKVVGGDKFQIVTIDPYPALYRETTDLALKEQNANARPKLANRVPNMANYDVIFLGFPIWWGTLPMALFSFLDEYDLSGKTIIPFCTHGGSQLGRSIDDIRKLEPRVVLREGLAIHGSDAAQAGDNVTKWLERLGYRNL